MKNEIGVKKTYTEEEKMKAAYVLNMCTVSVAQIIDYNDEYILEQEYDAILNNLNLKVIPKDEALLRILTEILNTITFFRIHDVKKEQIERQYQNRIKSAIWSAIPSVSVFVSGNPITMALSLATTVGTGYMNYRKEKMNAAFEKEKADMELQITAIEQLNALKRELFTTAWRLAEEYDFDDNFRLTEKQIKQYNEILMDQDELRKYARFEAIQEKFAAYPPFWYFFGHTASYISQSSQDEETKLYYLDRAKAHFEHYEKLNKFNILREDQMTASFALEYMDLLLLDADCNEQKVKDLIRIAIDKCGNNNDILQLCAMSCLRIGEKKEATRLLKILVNEEYNKVINAQLLSGLYVNARNRTEYNILMTRVSPRYLYPMPTADDCNTGELNWQFEQEQKSVLKEKFKQTLQRIIDKYSTEMNQKISVFDLEMEYSQDFFANSKRAKRERIACARNLFADEGRSRLYLERMQYTNLPLEYTETFQKMYSDIFSANCYKDLMLQGEVLNCTKEAIISYRESINQIQEKINDESFGVREYEKLQKIGLIGFVGKSFEKLYQYAAHQIESAYLDDLMSIEGNLMKLCSQMNIDEPEIAIEPEESTEVDFCSLENMFNVSMFGAKAIVAKNISDYVKEMLTFVKNKKNLIQVQEPEMKVIYKDQMEFERYFNNTIFEKYPSLKSNSIMILADNTNEKFDLIFTTEGIVYVVKNKVRKKIPYEDIRFIRDALDLSGKKYRSKFVDISALFELVKGLDKRFINNLDQKIEYMDGIVNARILNEWFKNQSDAMTDGVTRVYAWPKQELLHQMGYFIERELNKENFLLQFYYDKKTGYILNLRIVEFETLNPDFAGKLDKAGGVLRVER